MRCAHHFTTVEGEVGGQPGVITTCTGCGLRMELRVMPLAGGVLDVQGARWNAGGSPVGPAEQRLLQRMMGEVLGTAAGGSVRAWPGGLPPLRPGKRRGKRGR